MELPFETLVLVALVGAATGWCARFVSQEEGFGLIGDIVAGLVGAFAGAFAAPKLGVGPDASTFAVVATALVGAAIVVAGARYLADTWASQMSPRAVPDGRPLPADGDEAGAPRAPRPRPARPVRVSEAERSRLWMRES
ncbi:GlsB/YeaQ/YmgE family stress response membrane protein [Rhodoplanes sp. TEM]|uniref:GlsB/YeaQ/YmgE family stress response membrane protein n=1 Tax=Rhodoplanes tepidamans TaxID=200616 RepID=A0ABT5JB50_RHOTP|nr:MULTISPECIES: GlsB/YeaQ/YmgE family stress response membrane protein [Rhodoplanes]MDC7786275.1 GlsB/YeaQ/YmgE family stress response membrane protein [Rhodoplanes tepidamans]MDC7982354.1 GlsB/YeaQ/YmgE family stress response membrane protein [Rhodoplanes sp. TEM]MDQ0355074.1 putative membrane protein YeaQ/YmgE (transglycosylase-associated protein family) [Rhodoplanes tepidamans]